MNNYHILILPWYHLICQRSRSCCLFRLLFPTHILRKGCSRLAAVPFNNPDKALGESSLGGREMGSMLLSAMTEREASRLLIYSLNLTLLPILMSENLNQRSMHGVLIVRCKCRNFCLGIDHLRWHQRE